MNILLIEDSSDIIKGLKYSIEKNNNTLNHTTTIKDSIEYINNHNNIDFISFLVIILCFLERSIILFILASNSFVENGFVI